MRLQFATSSPKRNWIRRPLVFTEHGVVMAANVLNSSRAVKMSVSVVEAFVRYRKTDLATEAIARKLADLERAVGHRLDGRDAKLDELFRAVEALIVGPEIQRKRIGFV